VTLKSRNQATSDATAFQRQTFRLSIHYLKRYSTYEVTLNPQLRFPNLLLLNSQNHGYRLEVCCSRSERLFYFKIPRK